MILRTEYPVKVLCDVLDCARSSVYYQSTSAEDRELRQAIERLATQWITYGYRRITKCFSVRVGTSITSVCVV